MIAKPDWVQELSSALDKTSEVLNELEVIGLKHKKLAFFVFDNGTGNPYWSGLDEHKGYVTLFHHSEPRAVAHEMGHGAHECLTRDRGLPDRFGEDFAEAIRWFVEERLRGQSDWPNRFRGRADAARVVLETCHYDFDRFKRMLQDGSLFAQLAWK